MDYGKMGERIKLLRKSKNISQEKLSEMVGISPGFMSNIEIGNKPGAFDTYIRIANALDTTLDYLSQDIVPKASQTLRENEILHYFQSLDLKQQNYILNSLRNFCDFING